MLEHQEKESDSTEQAETAAEPSAEPGEANVPHPPEAALSQPAAEASEPTDSEPAEETSEQVEEEAEPSFEELLNQSEAATVLRVRTGQKLNGKVVAVSGGVAFINIGTRSEAELLLKEDDERHQKLVEGDTVEIYVVNPSGQIQVSLDPMLGYGDFSILLEAHENALPIKGKIERLITGGYEVNSGGVRCFCPKSQLGLRPVADPGSMIGQELEFKIIELDESSSNVVLSHRALLEDARRRQLEKTRERLTPGAVLEGTVKDIQSFGAFVDLGGIQGLLHISQLSYQSVDRVEDVVEPGGTIRVKILDISRDNQGKERISLSLKALLPDPWKEIAFRPGELVKGRVVRKSRFGVFVNLAPAVDGLLPRRMMKQAGRNVDMETFDEGQELEVEVVEINRGERKIALALPGWDQTLKSSLKAGDQLTVEVIKVLPVGVLVQGVDDPAKGLIHKRALKQGSSKQILSQFPQGSRHQVILDDVDDQGRFNFVLQTEEDAVDRETMSRFVDGKQDLAHNPFAAFFDKEDH